MHEVCMCVEGGAFMGVRMWITEPVVSIGELIRKHPGMAVHAGSSSIQVAGAGKCQV